MAIDKIKILIDKMQNIDRNIPEKDTGISWDGDILVYNDNMDKKTNLSSIFRVQVKGRTENKLPKNHYNFYVERADLENYLRDDGTIFFAVVFVNEEYKCFYSELLPYNLRLLLNDKANIGKKKIKVKMKVIYSSNQLEIAIRNFAIDREKQKRISPKVFDQIFNQKNTFIKDNNKITFFSTNLVTDVRELIGEEKYFYNFDKNENIVGVEYGKLASIEIPHNIKIYNYKKEEFYNSIIENVTENDSFWIFGNVFSIDFINNKFHINVKGTLNERIKEIKFIIDLEHDDLFYINDIPFKLNEKVKNIEKYEEQLKAYKKMKDFIEKHNIKKDINLDIWNDEDINNFLIWISAIEEKKAIRITNCSNSVLGSIKINDIRFSIFATKDENEDKFVVYSLWGDIKPSTFLFGYKNVDGEHDFETSNIFDVLNRDAYCSDDINFDEMKNSFNELHPYEENLINLQALEVISAYDITKNSKLLDYAEFLLKKIIINNLMKDIATINLMQIKKRKGNLSDDDNKILIDIRNNHIGENFFEISINLLLDNINEATIQFKNLNDEEKMEFNKFPISKFFNVSEK